MRNQAAKVPSIDLSLNSTDISSSLSRINAHQKEELRQRMYIVLQRLLFEHKDMDYVHIASAFTNETFKVFFKQAFDPSNNENAIIDLMKAGKS